MPCVMAPCHWLVASCLMCASAGAGVAAAPRYKSGVTASQRALGWEVTPGRQRLGGGGRQSRARQQQRRKRKSHNSNNKQSWGVLETGARRPRKGRAQQEGGEAGCVRSGVCVCVENCGVGGIPGALPARSGDASLATGADKWLGQGRNRSRIASVVPPRPNRAPRPARAQSGAKQRRAARGRAGRGARAARSK
ncbi:MAG: hypothetical protein J3K34DRAFT_411928 [Monoraphidium minutum]|nr:MAG: hypothetical protein J3K34DRAFT_411928 [Monoraphidium minutum]